MQGKGWCNDEKGHYLEGGGWGKGEEGGDGSDKILFQLQPPTTHGHADFSSIWYSGGHMSMELQARVRTHNYNA